MALLRLLVFCTLAACCVARSPPQTPLASFPLPRSCNDTEVRAVAGFALQSLNQDRKDGYALSLSRVHDVWEHFQASDSLWDSLWTGCRDQSGDGNLGLLVHRCFPVWKHSALPLSAGGLGHSCCPWEQVLRVSHSVTSRFQQCRGFVVHMCFGCLSMRLFHVGWGISPTLPQEDMGSVFYLTLDVLETDCHVLSKKAQKDCNPRVLHESVSTCCQVPAVCHLFVSFLPPKQRTCALILVWEREPS